MSDRLATTVLVDTEPAIVQMTLGVLVSVCYLCVEALLITAAQAQSADPELISCIEDQKLNGFSADYALIWCEEKLGVPGFSLGATRIVSGSSIPTVYSGEQLLIAPNETRSISLVTSTAIADERGNAVIPPGATVFGQFQSRDQGVFFVTEAVELNGQRYSLNAQSTSLFHYQKDPRQISGQAVIGDAAVGAAAGAILGGLLGNRVISTEKVVGSAVAGAVVGNVTAPQVAVINPNTPIQLVLQSDFTY